MRNAMLLIALCLPVAASAHLGLRILPVYELSSSDLPNIEDGTLEDWEAALPLGSFTHVDVEPAVGVQPLDPDDMAFRVFVAWHNASQRIYLGMEFLDDKLSASEIGPLGDGVSFFVDADHSGGQFDSFLDGEGRLDYSRNYRQAQAFSFYPYVYPGSEIQPGRYWTESPRVQVHGRTNGESPVHSVFESWIRPWDDFDPDTGEYVDSHLRPGGVIGIQMRVLDADETGSVSGQYNLATPTVSETITADGFTFSTNGFSDNFVDAELIPCFHGDCSRASATAVRPSSWARIKASFR